jgi:hypothetical protein
VAAQYASLRENTGPAAVELPERFLHLLLRSISSEARPRMACYHILCMVKTTVYLDEGTVAALRAISKRSARPQARLIRDALRAFTSAGNPPPLPAGMGMFDSGHTDTAARRKELLRQAAGARRWRS